MSGLPDWDLWGDAIFLMHPGGNMVWVTGAEEVAEYEAAGFVQVSREKYLNTLNQRRLRRAIEMYDEREIPYEFPLAPIRWVKKGLMDLGYENYGWLWEIRNAVTFRN